MEAHEDYLVLIALSLSIGGDFIVKRFIPFIFLILSFCCIIYALLFSSSSTFKNELIIIKDISKSVGKIPQEKAQSFIDKLYPDSSTTILMGATSRTTKQKSTNAINPYNTNIANALKLVNELPFQGSTKRRILLLSDGLENRGSTLKAASLLPKNTLIESIPCGESITPDARVKSVLAPASVNINQEFKLQVVAMCTEKQDAFITIKTPQNIVLKKKLVTLYPYYQGYNVQLKLNNHGLQQLHATIEIPNDKVPLNNTAKTALFINATTKVLWLGDPPPALNSILQIITQEPEVLTSDLLKNFSTVVLNNCSVASLPRSTSAILQSFTRNGGSLIIIGGDKSLYAGDWQNSNLEKLLPTELTPSLSNAYCFIIDSSGSMAETYNKQAKLQLALNALFNSLHQLNNNDTAAIVAFNNSSFTLLRPKKILDLKNFTPPTLKANGPTSIFAGTTKAIEILKNVEANSKHIIMLTDGQTLEKEDALNDAITTLNNDLKTNAISLSVISLGKDANLNLLRKITTGTFNDASDKVLTLPSILSSSLDSLQDNSIKENIKVAAIAPSNLTQSLKQNTILNKSLLLGNIKDKQRGSVLLSNENNQPLAVIANNQFGKILVLGGSPYADWTDSPWGKDFMTQILNDVSKNNTTGQLGYYINNGQIHLSFATSNTAQPPLQAAIYFNNQKVQPKIRLKKLANNAYAATLKQPPKGLYQLKILKSDSVIATQPLLIENNDEWLYLGADANALAQYSKVIYSPSQLTPWSEIKPATTNHRYPSYQLLIFALLSYILAYITKIVLNR